MNKLIGGYELETIHYKLMDRDVSLLPSETVAEFLDRNWSTVSPLVRRSVVKLAGMPANFYESLPPDLRKSILESACSKGHKDFLLLSNNGKVEYAAKALHSLELYNEDPFDLLGLKVFVDDSLSRGWRFDPHSGSCLYVFAEEDTADYSPSVELRVPVFYSSNLLLSYGLRKAFCNNRLIDPITQPEFSVRFDPYSARFGVADLVRAMVRQASARTGYYNTALNYLHYEKAGFDTVRAFLKNQAARDALKHAPLGKLKAHLRLVVNGLPLPANSPLSFDTWYDVMDTLSFYGSRMNDLDKQRIGSSEIFNYFFSGLLRNLV